MAENTAKVSLLNIISIIIGSGLVVFLANILYNDFIGKPLINITIKISSDNSSGNATITNTGLKTAKNVRLAMYTDPPGKIDNVNPEGVTAEQITITDLTKLPPYTQGRIATFNRSIIGDNSIAFDIKFTKFDQTGSFIILANHDDGSNQATAKIGEERKTFTSSPPNPLSNPIFLLGLSVIIEFVLIFGKTLIMNPIITVRNYSILEQEKKKIMKVIKMLNQNSLYKGKLQDWSKSKKLRMRKILCFDEYRRFEELFVENRRRENYLIPFS